jgi:hypothetical protein
LRAQTHNYFDAAQNAVSHEALVFANAMSTAVVREIVPVMEVILANEPRVPIPHLWGEVSSRRCLALLAALGLKNHFLLERVSGKLFF